MKQSYGEFARHIEDVSIDDVTNFLLLSLLGPSQMDEPAKIKERLTSMQKLASVGADCVLHKSELLPLLRNLEVGDDDTMLEDDLIRTA